MPTLQEKVIDLVGYSNAAVDKAAADRAAHQKVANQCSELAKTAADALVSHDRMNEEDRASFLKAAADPREVLKLLSKVAEHRSLNEQGTLGSPVHKQANTQSGIVKAADSPYAGVRRSQPTEADAKLFAGLGLAPPTGN